MILEVVYEALENAGIASDTLKGTNTGVFIALGITAWIVTDILRKPLDRFLQDVRPFAELNFDSPFRGTTLPELTSLTGQMEQIRLTLKRYQRINVEQIITQEQRNRMLMTHASVLVGHFDESGAWLFRNEAMTALLGQISSDDEWYRTRNAQRR